MPFHDIYKTSMALLTDHYQLMMAYGYWKNKLQDREAVFHHFFRRSPFQGGFTVAAGLEYLINFVENYHFDSSDLSYLSKLVDNKGQQTFSAEFLDYLANLKFTCEIDAVPEGTIVYPYEPLVRVQGPLIQCQLLESPLLNLMNFSTLIATKAARMCIASKGDPIVEFGMRRAQGVDGSLTASRSAYIGGCCATSNLLAGKLFDIPVKGTQAHSWIMAFDDEIDAFRAFAAAMPNNCVFLVDTYDSIEGVKKAIQVGIELKASGKSMLGIRLDSGDLTDLSIKSRRLLDDAGFTDAIIFASNELDESIISELKRQGAQIGMWGVGTNLVTAKDHPALDGVYKLSALREVGGEWKYKLKLSEQMLKVSNPGILQIRRFSNESNHVADMVYDVNIGLEKNGTLVDLFDSTKQKVIKKDLSYQDLLIPIFRNGKKVYSVPSLKEIQETTKQNLSKFPVGIKRFINPHQYLVGMEKNLYQEKVKLIQEIRQQIESNHF